MMKSDGKHFWYNLTWKSFKTFKSSLAKSLEDFDNKLGKSLLALRIVPLPNFTKNSIPENKVEYNLLKIIVNILWFIFLPRWYKIGRNDSNMLSHFSRMILYENNDDIYDNPAIEAVIDFRWRKARNFLFFLFIRFVIFALSFVFVSWAYLVHEVINEGHRDLLIALIVIFYYLAFYLFATEILQLWYRGPRKYFGDAFNILDIASIALAVTAMSAILKNFQFSNSFGSVKEVDTNLTVWIAFSIFILWVQLVGFILQFHNNLL